ncbi:2-methylisocitrate lyase-like PEP mutase family enzyme [Anaerospora hongkongensis]|uniref:2-methylisocitrate lyase-like PEP mutase family enzyme n=1 Tax=Anaerospora hongkongensis TaxID=244830 RepID=A0A4R1Q2S6_9FIRM|nr:isocitrate lyase/PEP mutase family protein [Anaerospora hongkongensis]TCL38860.1 2-methylisocitrate lyase-like PEP mutase family enzyme [Anaerospora hongkongensis]
MRKSTRLRQILAAGKTVVKPGAYDALSAMILEKAGFQVIGLSGFALSFALLGKPDVGLTTMSEVVRASKYISSAVQIPLIADADTGFGNAINTMRTTEEFIMSGAAAIHIEDQEFPKRCGHTTGKTVVSRDEMVGKIRAAVKVRDELDKDFVIIARSDVRGVSGGSVDALIDRLKACVDAGADMVFPEALVSVEELERIVEEVKAPIHYNRSGGGLSPLIPLTQLQEMGVIMASDAVSTMRAAGTAMWHYAKGMLEGDMDFSAKFLEELKAGPLGDMKAMQSFVGGPQIREFEKEFLPAEELKKYENTTGLF